MESPQRRRRTGMASSIDSGTGSAHKYMETFTLSFCQRNTTLLLGALLMLCGGTPYMVGLFSSVLKSKMGYTETQTVLVETCTHVGLYCGITQGIFYDKFGMRRAGFLATILVSMGYLGVYFALSANSGASVVGFLFFLIGQGSHGFYTIAASTNIRNHRKEQKGKVMGFLAAMFAMSGAVFTPVAWRFGIKATSEPRTNSSEICNPPVHTLPRGHPTRTSLQQDEFLYFLFMSALLAVVGLVASLTMKREPPQTIPTPLEVTMLPLEGSSDEEESESSSDLPSNSELDIYGFDLLTDARFILLFICMLIEDGTAVMFSNTISSTHGAIQHDVQLPKVGTLLIAFSASSATGRAGWGIISDFCFRRRPFVLACTMILMTCGHALMALYPHQLVLATVIIGVAFGGMFAIAPVICAEQFGNRHFGTNWGCIVFAPALGSISFNALYGAQYEVEQGECAECYGTKCFQDTYTIATVCCLVGIILNFWMVSKVNQAERPENRRARVLKKKRQESFERRIFKVLE